MKIDTRGLAVVLEELNVLDQKDLEGGISKQEQRRRASLMSQAAAIRSGVKLKDIIRREHNEHAREQGLPEFESEPKPSKRERRMAAWEAVIKNSSVEGTAEHRDMNVGSIISQIGSYTGLGFFIPTNFFGKVWDAMKAHDALFDDDAVMVLHTDNGRPTTIPVYDDTSSVSSVLGESSQYNEQDIADVDLVKLGAWRYDSTLFRCSIEAFQDCSEVTVPQLFKKFASDKLARGIGKDLVTGSGVGKPTGLITFLHLAAAPQVTAAGSAPNDGSASTGSNSLGSADFMTALQTLDSKYWGSEKLAWFMNRNTLTKVLNLSDKQGRPLGPPFINCIGSQYFIYGIPVRICPSMDNITNASTPVVLMDGSYWFTRLVLADPRWKDGS